MSITLHEWGHVLVLWLSFVYRDMYIMGDRNVCILGVIKYHLFANDFQVFCSGLKCLIFNGEHAVVSL